GNWPMLSAVMLSWMLGAMRFSSIARICDARTPTTLTTDNVCAFSFSVLVPLSFFFCDGSEAGADCSVVACADRVPAWPSEIGDAAADVATTANSDAEMASDNGLL